MIYQGNAVSVQLLDDGIAELKFDLQGESVNKFNKETVEDLGKAVDAIKGNSDIKGLVVTSGKSVFIVGADITEFTDMFKLPEDEIAGWCLKSNQVFNAFEDLDIPKVDVLENILGITGVQKKAAFMVGDRETDMTAGTNVGIRTVGVSWGFGSRSELSSAEVVVDSPTDLLRYFRNAQKQNC